MYVCIYIYISGAMSYPSLVKKCQGKSNQETVVIRHIHLNRWNSAIRLLAGCSKKKDPPLQMMSPINRQHLGKIDVFMF